MGKSDLFAEKERMQFDKEEESVPLDKSKERFLSLLQNELNKWEN